MKTTPLAVFILSFILLLSGCATSYDTEKSFWSFGEGFDVVQIADDSWQISFVGNDMTDRALARKYVLRKSAEIVQAHGYPYFALTTEQNHRDAVGNDTLGFGHDDWGYGLGKVENETSVIVEVTGLQDKESLQTTKVYDAAYLIDHLTW
ncbi:hypothetical protein GNT65_09805 [Shewanella sp. JBTF-M18]|uniref:DUF4823 domain-containing protein n=1 Tax=Shewanella insulae TaxID=2681496 RepID=A0A6L7HY77_9GAMM|nr:hypothetical protein [Shewanella insulae]MXR68960.1 hypothetical protein [Shewanella insulae]